MPVLATIPSQTTATVTYEIDRTPQGNLLLPGLPLLPDIPQDVQAPADLPPAGARGDDHCILPTRSGLRPLRGALYS
jgi:hypothetical protein